jgi:hypothetical protein
MPKKAPRKRIQKDGKYYTVRGVELTRNDGWWTEAEFWARIRSALRGMSKWWRPKLRHLEDGSRPYKGTNKRIKKEYQCERCKKWFVKAKIEMDHIDEVGSLVCVEDIPGFINRLFIEYGQGWMRLCKPCHLVKTNTKRGDKLDVYKKSIKTPSITNERGKKPPRKTKRKMV